MTYKTILVEDDGPVRWVTLNRPEAGNTFTLELLHEMKHALERSRVDDKTRVLVITGAGDKFFCLGGDKSGLPDTHTYRGVLPVVDVYELIEKHPKPVIASVNGFAVGGGHVLQVVCDISIAKESAIFRQVGPLMGSFDAGYGTWYLEDTVGKKRAKEIWFLNEKLTATQALSFGLINRVVPDHQLREATRELALTVAQRGSQALAVVKSSFAARSAGASGLSRMAHDLLLRYYLESEEAKELARSFSAHEPANPQAFGH